MGVTNFDEVAVASPLPLAAIPSAIPNSKLASPQGQDSINFHLAGTVAAGVDKAMALVPLDCTIVRVIAYAMTPPTGAALILDIHRNGTTIYTTQAARPTIAIGANASSATAPAVVALTSGDRLTVDLDQVGSGTAGADVLISILVKRANVA